MKLLRVCIPFYSEFETAKPGLRELVRHFGADVDILPVQGTYIWKNRNYAVNERRSNAIRQEPLDYEWFLFVDSDIGFTLDHVLALLAHDRPIVSASYLCHGSDTAYQCGTFLPGAPGIVGAKYTTEERGLHPVDWCGGGMLLVHRSVFGEMRYPWFREYVIEWNGGADVVGEDIGFCVGAAQAGFPLMVDFDNPVYHKPRRAEQYNFCLEELNNAH